MENRRIIKDLGNGFSLCVEAGENPDYPNEVYIGLIDKHGVWVQDLVIVQESYAYAKDGKTIFDPDEIAVSVFADEASEDYTDQFKIKRYIDPEEEEA